MSTHEALVIVIGDILPHPDVETVRLGLTKVYDYTVVVAKDSWKKNDLAIFIEPDTLVDLSLPSFSFLQNPEKPKDKHRVSAKRLRGVWSEGLLTPALEGMKPGDNAWEALKLERYEPPLKPQRKSGPSEFSREETENGPTTLNQPSKFDLENYKKHSHIFGPEKVWSRKPFFNQETKEFDPGEFVLDVNYIPPEIVITEKIHGSNYRAVYDGERMYYGSREQWKKMPIKGQYRAEETEEEFALRLKKSFWMQVAIQNPWIDEWCKENPKMFLFGEVFGNQDLKYGIPGGKVGFRAFQVWDSEAREFWNFQKRMKSFERFIFPIMNENPEALDNLITAPILYIGPYSDEKVKFHTDGKTRVRGIPGNDPNHIREGCVVEAMNDGRILKSVSNVYYQR